MKIESSNICTAYREFSFEFFHFHSFLWITMGFLRECTHISQFFFFFIDFYFIQFPNIHCIWRRLNLWSQFLFGWIASFHIICTLSCSLDVLFCADVLTFAPFARMQSENESSCEREPFNQSPLNRISEYHCFYWLNFLQYVWAECCFISRKHPIQTSNKRLARLTSNKCICVRYKCSNTHILFRILTCLPPISINKI